MRILAIVLLSIGCGDVTADDGSCERTCRDMQPLLRDIIDQAGGAITRNEYNELCTAAPEEIDCETCFTYIQEAVLEPFSVAWDCGCGLSNVGVRTCRQDLEMERDDAEVLLDACVETCRDERLRL